MEYESDIKEAQKYPPGNSLDDQKLNSKWNLTLQSKHSFVQRSLLIQSQYVNKQLIR